MDERNLKKTIWERVDNNDNETFIYKREGTGEKGGIREDIGGYEDGA